VCQIGDVMKCDPRRVPTLSPKRSKAGANPELAVRDNFPVSVIERKGCVESNQIRTA
jgi:hypothetical protein